MFGYIKPFVPELKVKEYDFYKSVYCGLCRATGKRISCASRFALSYDLVFLALVHMALNGDEIKITMRRCMVHPLKKRPMMEISPSLSYAACAGALLTYYNLLDKIKDTRSPKKWCYALLYPTVSTMRKRARIYDALDGCMAQKLSELEAAEKADIVSPDQAAGLFGDLLAAVFAEGITDEKKKRIASTIGMYTGRWIYLVDAADDLEKDKKRGEYNPFIHYGAVSAETAEAALTMELRPIETALSLIDYGDRGIESILQNMIYLGMPKCAGDAARRAFPPEISTDNSRALTDPERIDLTK